MNFDEVKFRRALKYKKLHDVDSINEFVKGTNEDANLIKYYSWIITDEIGLIFEDIDKRRP